MTSLRRGIDFTVDLLTAMLWALAAFFAGARLLSRDAGALLALAVFVTAISFILTSRAEERRARAIAGGVCPRCRTPLVSEHEHRRWDSEGQSWLPALTTWRCRQCGFQQEAPLACESCPS